MRTYVALLRAINLGSRNKIAMADLRSLFAALEAEDVTTYVQSGNVVFRSGARKPVDLTEAIEQRIRRDLGLDVRVLLRTRAELATVVAGNPFTDGEPDANLHVTFLAETPSRTRIRDLDPQSAPPDELHVAGREVYLRCPNGYGRSKLTNAFFEKRLGVAATTRNWRTVTKLAELASA